MADITMCKGERCPLKNRCYRYTANPDPLRQSYFVDVLYDTNTKSCNEFWECEPIKTTAHKTKLNKEQKLLKALSNDIHELYIECAGDYRKFYNAIQDKLEEMVDKCKS